MRALATLLICVTIVVPAAAQTASGPQIALDAIVAPLAKPDAPGCVSAVAERGVRIATSAFGMADLEHGVANSAESVFEAGSVSKQFTAAATLLLIADGKIALTDDVRKYLPELPDFGTPITINHLLSHTSGLRDWGGIAQIGGWERGTRAYTNEDVLRIMARQKALNYRPGEEYSYTNSGYNLLALIVERVSGQSLAAFTRARIFVPLGMAHTQWRDDFRQIVKNHAIAYNSSPAGWEEARPFEDAYGNGGLLTTVGDLLIWNDALSADRIGPGITAQMQERATLNGGARISYARGLVVGRYRDADSVSHSGSTGGYRAWLERFPANGLSIAVLCNGGSFVPTAIGRAFADSRLAAPIAQASSAQSLATDDPHSGTFVNQATGKPLQFKVVDGRLKPEDGPSLEAAGIGRFRTGQTEIVFASTDRFEYSAPDGQRTNFVRAAPFAPGLSALTAYAGHYLSTEAEAAYDVTVEAPGLRLTLASRPTIGLLAAPAYWDAFVSGDMVLRFRRDARDRIVGMSVGISRVRDVAFTKMSH